ncbi:hypothetical protein ACFU7D_20430 [Nocardioides sp. NPDC057577]|uniref:hypothetical protein n=1 Tax=Nocardioides sp. NPDC057577 TaxID=3346171 RepID=UPI003672BE76
MSRRGEFGRSVLLFVGFGFGWAVAARLFMRFFSDDPSFTLQGTGMIVGLVLLEFIGLGAVRDARRSGRTRWWRLAPVPGLLLYFSLGMVFVPCVVAGLVVGRCRRAPVIGLVTLVGVAGSIAVPVVLMLGDSGIPMAPTFFAGMVLYVACCLGLVAASSEWSRPWRRPIRTSESPQQPAYAGGL